VRVRCEVLVCARGDEAPGGMVTGESKVTLEMLTRHGCATTPLMLERVDAARGRIAGAPRCTVVDVGTLPTDDVRRRYPTPTVLVGGRDLFGLPARASVTAPT